MVENLSYLGSQYSRVSIRLYRLILLRNPVHFLNQSMLPERKPVSNYKAKSAIFKYKNFIFNFQCKRGYSNTAQNRCKK